MTQAAFHSALLNPEEPPPAGLTDPKGRPAGKRFDVYRNNVAVSLTSALEVGFPVLRRLLGQEFFTALAGTFLRTHPPSSRLMMHYGAEMVDFISNFPPVAHLPYLPDIARLEHGLRASYHAADVTPLNAASLAAMPPDQLLRARLQLAPPVRLIRSRYPVWSIWRANTEPDAPAPVMRPEDVLVLRPAFDPAPHLLPAGGAAFVAALDAKARLIEAVEAAGPAFDLPATLDLLLQGAALAGLQEDNA